MPDEVRRTSSRTYPPKVSCTPTHANTKPSATEKTRPGPQLKRNPDLHLHCEVVTALLEGLAERIQQIHVISRCLCQHVAAVLPRASLAHAEAELGVVFEQGVGPGRTLSLVVRGVREGWVGATPDRGAAC